MTSRFSEHEHGFDLFGTSVLLHVGPSAGGPLDSRVSALRVHARLQALHNTLSRFEPGSELTRLNARQDEDVPVSTGLLRAVQAALFAARLSGGLVDPTLLPDLERAGYAASRAGSEPADLREALATAPPRRAAAPRASADWERIRVDAARRTVRLPAGVRLDLGGSAKGMAVDLAARMLAAKPTFAVDAGGDIRLGGTDAAPRTVNIAHPLDDADGHGFSLRAGAIATSGLRTRVWRTPNGHAHHLIDPHSGRPAWTGVTQATALAPTALEAETLAKTALLRGPHAGRKLLARNGGALVLDDGELILTGRLTAGPSTAALAA